MILTQLSKDYLLIFFVTNLHPPYSVSVLLFFWPMLFWPMLVTLTSHSDFSLFLLILGQKECLYFPLTILPCLTSHYRIMIILFTKEVIFGLGPWSSKLKTHPRGRWSVVHGWQGGAIGQEGHQDEIKLVYFTCLKQCIFILPSQPNFPSISSPFSFSKGITDIFQLKYTFAKSTNKSLYLRQNAQNEPI